MSKYTLKNTEGIQINNQLFINDSLEFTNNDLEGIVDFVGGAGVIVIDSSISTPFSFGIQDELLNNFLTINGTNGNITVYNLLSYNSDPTGLTNWGDLSVPTKAYVDAQISGVNELSEILTNGNTTSNGQTIDSLNGGGQLDLRQGADDFVILSNDSGAYTKGNVSMDADYIWVEHYSSSGFGGVEFHGGNGVTNLGSVRLFASSEFLQSQWNVGISFNSAAGDRPSTIISSDNGTIDSNIRNTVIAGGTGISGTASNTLFTQNFETKSLVFKVDDDNDEVTVYGGEKLRKKTPQTLTSASTITWDMDSGANANLTLGTNGTVDITNMESGDYGTIVITQDGVGSRTIIFGDVNGGGGTHTSVSGGGGSITLTSTASAVDILSFYYNGTTVHWSAGYDYT